MERKKFRVYLENGSTFTIDAASYSFEKDEVVFRDEHGKPITDRYIDSDLAVAIVRVDRPEIKPRSERGRMEPAV
jgi:hypothetical protein